MAELKKRKKSLNQIVNPSNPNKQTYFGQNSQTNTTSFRPGSIKSKTKKSTLVNPNVSSHYSYSNLIPLKTDIPKSNSKKTIVKINLIISFIFKKIFVDSKGIPFRKRDFLYTKHQYNHFAKRLLLFP